MKIVNYIDFMNKTDDNLRKLFNELMMPKDYTKFKRIFITLKNWLDVLSRSGIL